MQYTAYIEIDKVDHEIEVSAFIANISSVFDRCDVFICVYQQSASMHQHLYFYEPVVWSSTS